MAHRGGADAGVDAGENVEHLALASVGGQRGFAQFTGGEGEGGGFAALGGEGAADLDGVAGESDLAHEDLLNGREGCCDHGPEDLRT